MTEPKILAIVISIVSSLLGALIMYVIKMKDKSEDNTKSTLGEIKTLVTNINLTIGTIKVELDNNIYATKELIKDVRILTAKSHSLELKVNNLVQQKINLEKDIQELKKRIK